MKCFKINLFIAIDKLIAEKYIINNVCNLRESVQYVQTILRYNKFIVYSEEARLLYTWKRLDPELRVHIRMSDRTTTVSNFVQFLEDMKFIWYEIHRYQP